MYLDEEQIELGVLRQGDVISRIHILGALNTGGIQYASTASEPGVIKSWSVPNKPTFADAMCITLCYQKNPPTQR